MFGQIAAFLALVSVAFANSCGQCYSGFGGYVNSPVISVLPTGGFRRVLSTGCNTEVIPRVPALPFVASEGCETPIVAARTCSTPVIATESCETPVIAARTCSTPVIATESCETPVIAARTCSTPVIATEGCETPVVTRVCGTPVSVSSRVYATPLYRETLGRPEVYSSCENTPVVGTRLISSGVSGLREIGCGCGSRVVASVY